MSDQSQVDFLIDKLLTVSENTIESLVKLREELKSSKSDHIRCEETLDKIKQTLDIILDKEKEMERTINEFKEKKPFDTCDEICTDINSIKKDMTEVKDKDKALRKLLVVALTISAIIIAVFEVFRYVKDVESIITK